MRLNEPLKMTKNSHKNSVANYFSHCVHYWEEVYEGRDRVEEFAGYAQNKRKCMVLANLDAYACQRQLSILDIGCGPGVFIEEALRRGHAVSGIDLTEDMVRKANERLKKYVSGEETPCKQGDIEDLPFAGNSMDVVLCLGVLPYLHDDRKGIAEMRRVLKKGGMGIVVLPNLLKIGNMFDPYYYLCRSWQYLWYQVLNRKKAVKRPLISEDFGANRTFGIRRYTCRQVDALFQGNDLRKAALAGIEYGPLTFWGNSILPERLSIRTSDCIDRVSRKHGFSWLTTFANQWVISFIKN